MLVSKGKNAGNSRIWCINKEMNDSMKVSDFVFARSSLADKTAALDSDHSRQNMITIKPLSHRTELISANSNRKQPMNGSMKVSDFVLARSSH